MKKILSVILASICLLGVCVNMAYAASPYEDTSDDICADTGFDDPLLCGNKNKNEEAEMFQKIGNALTVVYGLVGILAVIFVIVGGFKFTTSQGDPGKVAQAKNTILFSLIGLVITLGAFAITSFVLNALGGTGGTGSPSTGSDGIASLYITSKDIVKEGETLQLKVKIAPDYAKDKTLTFTSSDTTVATIDENGLISGIKAGTTTITATAKNGVSTTGKITVTKEPTVESIKLEPSSVTIKTGTSTTIKATISPSSASSTSLTWTSSDTSVVTVANSGAVKGIKEGTATITVKGGDVTATATVTVSDTAAAQPPTGGGETYSAVWELRTYDGMEYWISVPEGATSNMALFIFLHGDAEMGNANRVSRLKWAEYVKEGKDFIGLVPVGKNRDWVSSGVQERVKGLIDKYVSEYKVNTSRIYIAGFSRGAIGTWGMVSRYGSFFRAAVPVSCCGSYKPEMFKNTPVYALAGGGESNYITCMKSRVNGINSAGGNAQFETIGKWNHGNVMANFPYEKVFTNWMLKQ